MIAAYHLIWTGYGSWLPNDPRGSHSESVRREILLELGEIHHGRKKIQPSFKELRGFYEKACKVLRHESRAFSESEIALLGKAFSRTVESERNTCYGCAIMPDHVHLVIRVHRQKAEEMIERFQENSKTAILEAGHWESFHPVWGGPGWKVFLETREDIERTIRYIEYNPMKAGREPQKWDFVSTYDGWLPGIGAPRG